MRSSSRRRRDVLGHAVGGGKVWGSHSQPRTSRELAGGGDFEGPNAVVHGRQIGVSAIDGVGERLILTLPMGRQRREFERFFDAAYFKVPLAGDAIEIEPALGAIDRDC